MQQTFAITFLVLFCLVMLYGGWVTIKNTQYAKQKLRQAQKEKEEINRVYAQTPTAFTQDGYVEFEDTELMEQMN